MQNNKWDKIIIMLIAIPIFFFSKAYAQEDSGIAVSGSFYSYEYHILQGGSIDSPLVNIVLFNNNANEIRIKLDTITPDGIEIISDKGLISIKPNQKVTIPVIINVNSSVAPGTYDIAITFHQQKIQQNDVLNISSLVSLDTTITVYNEAGYIDLTLLNTLNDLIEAEVFVKRVNESSDVSPILYSSNGKISGNIPPGEYIITAFVNEQLVHKSTVNLENSGNITKNIYADMIEIEDIELRKILGNEQKNYIQSLEISFSLNNMMSTIDDVLLSLNVYQNGDYYESIDMFRINELYSNTNDFSYYYSPSDGWSNEEYSFEIETHKEFYDISKSTLISTISIDKSAASSIIITNADEFTDFIENTLPFALIVILVICIILLIISLSKRNSEKSNIVPLTIDEFLDDLFASEEQFLDTVEPSIDAISKKNSEHKDIALNNYSLDLTVRKAYNLNYTKNEIIYLVIDYYETLPKIYLCPVCSGSGTTLYNKITEECIYCNGVGRVINGMAIPHEHLTACVKCNDKDCNRPNNVDESCTFCNGYKYTIIGAGAVFKDNRKLKIHNISHEIIEEAVNEYINKNDIILRQDDMPQITDNGSA